MAMKHVWILSALLTLWGCTASNSNSSFSANDHIISEQGQVRYVDLEGGFYGIVSGSGRYQPINLPAQFKVHKKDVTFKARLRPDVMTIHMWGKPIEIIDIK